MVAQQMEAGLTGNPARYGRTPFVQSVQNRHIHGDGGWRMERGRLLMGVEFPLGVVETYNQIGELGAQHCRCTECQ